MSAFVNSVVLRGSVSKFERKKDYIEFDILVGNYSFHCRYYGLDLPYEDLAFEESSVIELDTSVWGVVYGQLSQTITDDGVNTFIKVLRFIK